MKIFIKEKNIMLERVLDKTIEITSGLVDRLIKLKSVDMIQYEQYINLVDKLDMIKKQMDGQYQPLRFTAVDQNVVIRMSVNDNSLAVKYRMEENGQWLDYISDTQIKLNGVGKYVQFYNQVIPQDRNSQLYRVMILSGRVNGGGNIQSLLNYSDSCLRSCYSNMFNACYDLNYIKVNFTEWHTNATINWVINISNDGVFECPNGLSIQYNENRVPNKTINWSVVNF